jgi:predicted kinase
MERSQRDADVARLFRAIQPLLTAPVEQPVLIVLSGLPASGKSTLARRLAELLPAVDLETDFLRRQLVGRPAYTAEENERLFTACHALIERLLRERRRVIFDATNLFERYRERLSRIAEEAGARLILVWVEAPPEVAQERLLAREQGRPEAAGYSEAGLAVYERMSRYAQPPRRPHFVVDSSRDDSQVIEQIVREATRPPEVVAPPSEHDGQP